MTVMSGQQEGLLSVTLLAMQMDKLSLQGQSNPWVLWAPVPAPPDPAALSWPVPEGAAL